MKDLGGLGLAFYRRIRRASRMFLRVVFHPRTRLMSHWQKSQVIAQGLASMSCQQLRSYHFVLPIALPRFVRLRHHQLLFRKPTNQERPLLLELSVSIYPPLIDE